MKFKKKLIKKEQHKIIKAKIIIKENILWKKNLKILPMKI
jgi:hypothetical protein